VEISAALAAKQQLRVGEQGLHTAQYAHPAAVTLPHQVNSRTHVHLRLACFATYKIRYRC
jgi:hypothetical protein